MHVLATAAIVCGASFHPLPAGWQRSQLAGSVFARGGAQVYAWAASFRPSPRYGVSRDFPSEGVYIGVNLIRPPAYGAVWLVPQLHLPLRLRRADVSPFEGPRLTMYRFLGRYRSQYNVDVQVLFRRPSGRLLVKAQRALSALVLPRWTPVPDRCR